MGGKMVQFPTSWQEMDPVTYFWYILLLLHYYYIIIMIIIIIIITLLLLLYIYTYIIQLYIYINCMYSTLLTGHGCHSLVHFCRQSSFFLEVESRHFFVTWRWSTRRSGVDGAIFYRPKDKGAENRWNGHAKPPKLGLRCHRRKVWKKGCL